MSRRIFPDDSADDGRGESKKSKKDKKAKFCRFCSLRPFCSPRLSSSRDSSLQICPGTALSEQLEGMPRLIAGEDRNAPEHAQRLYRARRLDLAHIGRLPTELIEDFSHCLFCRVVITANEHRRLAPFEARVDH